MNRFRSIFLVVFVLFFTMNQQTFSNPTEIQSIIEKAKPDRRSPWEVSGSILRFNEYFISTLKSECGFRAFGYTSKEVAINAMLDALKDKSTLVNTLRAERLRQFIDNDHDNPVNFSSAESYLNNIKKTKHELSYQPNENVYDKKKGIQKIIEKPSYTLIDAFASLNNKNLYIYEVDLSKNKTLFLSHSYIINNNAESLYLLRKGFHYNKLVLINDLPSNNVAQNLETQYHQELRNHHIEKLKNSYAVKSQRNQPYSNHNLSNGVNSLKVVAKINNNNFCEQNSKKNKEIKTTKTWKVLNKTDRQFSEYSFSNEYTDSIYKGLGYGSQKEAINALLDVLNNPDNKFEKNKRDEIKKYISNEMLKNSNLLDYTKINNIDYYTETKNQFDFLTTIKKNKVNISFSCNTDKNGVFTPEKSQYGLMSALALLKDRNLYIYKKHDNQHIRLIHFYQIDPKKFSIYLIDNNTHFNKLVPTNDKEGLKKAQEIEDKLNPITQKKTSSGVIGIDNNTQSQDHIIHNNNYIPNVTEIRSRSNNIMNEIQRVDLTEKEILNFLNDDSPRAKIRGFDFKTSCQKIYDYYTFVDVNSDNNDSKFEDDCALAILFLSKNFVPSSMTKKEFCEDLLSKLNFIIKVTGSDAKTNKYRHYARIYKARIYIALEKYQKAWVELIDLYFQKTSYTKCYHLDIAELIIDHQFTPKNTTRDQALAFAKSLLRTTGSRPNSTRKSHIRSVNISTIFHPNYRNDIESRQKEYQLSKKIEAEENIISDDSSSDDSSSGFSSDESDVENPFIEVSNDSMNKANPIVSNNLKRKRPISSERLSKHPKINESDEIQNNNNIVYENNDENIEEEIEYVEETFSDKYLGSLKNKSRQALLRGNYYTARNLNKALKFYTEGIKKYPSADLYRALGNHYYYQFKNYVQAKEIYKEGIQKCPSSALYCLLGDLYHYELKDFKQAKKICEEGIEKYPSSGVYRALGNLYYYELKDFKQAEEIYEKGIKLYPSADLYRALGNLYCYELKDFKQAKKTYEEGIEKYPSSGLYAALGNLYRHGLKDFNQAEKIYKEGIQKYPSSDLYRALGELNYYQLKGSEYALEQAITEYQNGINLYPSSDLYRALGDLYCYELKNYEQAKEIYEEGIQKYPSASLYCSLGNLYCYKLKNYEQAKEIYEEGIQKYPSSDLYRALGDLHRYELKDFEEAKKLYKEGIQKYPSADLYRVLGNLYKHELKDFEEAKKIYQVGINLYPSSDLYRSLGDLYHYELKDFEEAKKLYREGIKLYSSSDLYRALGDLYCYELKDFEEATKIYQKGINLYPSSDLYRALGNLYCRKLKDYKQAEKAYEEGAQKYPSADIYRALGDLYCYDLAQHEKNPILKKEYQIKAFEAYLNAFNYNDPKINTKIEKPLKFLYKELMQISRNERIDVLPFFANLYVCLGCAYYFDLTDQEEDLDLKKEYQQKALAVFKKAFAFGDAAINAKIQEHIDFLEKALQKK
ncbi:MAG: tetratricopeptide repeat protein [Alphaproteobacteria bacterium]|nr:tetratricopeptide repeat protein [Alphaproteobacteria bacterium]